MTIITEFTGLDGIGDYFKRMPDVTARAARLAINTVLHRGGMRAIQTAMYGQINFPKGYLSGDRLFVSKLATERDLEGAILGRKRATSLARFAAPGTPIGSIANTSGVSVTVQRGRTQHLKKAWLVRLRQGKSLTEDQYNVGLAVRVRPGDSIRGKRDGHQAWLNPQHTVALLYGPSVDQVFRSVADDTGPEILNQVAAEFFRQFDRLA